MAQLRVLVLECGAAPVRLLGPDPDMSRWFARALPDVDFSVASALEPPLPKSAPYQGLIAPGSPLSITEPEDWTRRAADYLLDLPTSFPVLGVCLGAQLIGWAHGAPVVPNPLGREAGCATVDLTPAGCRDPLFRGLGESFLVHQSHADHLQRLPLGAELLASSSHSAIQAFALGPAVRGLQWHPELSAAQARLLARLRRTTLDAQRHDGYQRVRRSIKECASGPAILRNWIENFVTHHSHMERAG
jgi:GMP synthase (glutamine-hydrolysing)